MFISKKLSLALCIGLSVAGAKAMEDERIHEKRMLAFIQMYGSVEQALLVDAAQRGDIGGITAALKKGAAVNRRTIAWTPLMVAVGANQEAAVRCLLELGADASAKEPECGFTPMSLAQGDPGLRVAPKTSIIVLLRKHGARD